MPQFAIQPDQIRRVTADRILGRQTTTGPAEELSAADAKTLLSLGTTDSPQFAKIGIGTAASGSNDITFAPYASISVTGGIVINTDGNYRVGLNYSGRGIQAAKTLPIGWEDATNLGSAASDTKIYRDDAGVIAQRNGTNSQSFRIYNTDDGSQTNYERGSIGWDSSIFQIGTEAAGTGTTREVGFIGSKFNFDPTGSASNIDCDLKMIGKGTATGRLWLQGGTLAPNKIFSTGNVSTATARQLDITVGTSTIGISILTSGGVSMPNLPTSDPASAGELWNDSGTLKVSAG